jgi:hypothetical protein
MPDVRHFGVAPKCRSLVDKPIAHMRLLAKVNSHRGQYSRMAVLLVRWKDSGYWQDPSTTNWLAAGIEARGCAQVEMFSSRGS